MKTFKQYINEAASSFPQLKPKLFFKKKETWKSTYALVSYIKDLKNGISQLKHDAIDDTHKKIMQNLVDNPDDNCLRGTEFSKMSQVPNGEKFVQKLNNDFGEAIGPIKILRDRKFMPWIKSVTEIFVPDQSNYPFMDYSITDQEGVMHKISAKTAKGLGNTVKPTDILTTIEDTLTDPRGKRIMNMLFMNDDVDNKSKYKTEYDLLLKIFKLANKETKTIPNILTTAYLLVKQYGAEENADFLDAYELAKNHFDKLPPYEQKIDGVKIKADYTEYKVENTKYPNVKSLMQAADKLITKYSKAPYKINKAMKLLINLAFKDKVYYAKFAVKPNGDTVWEVRGRNSDYSSLYKGNVSKDNKSGLGAYTTIYLDAKGARGKDKVGLRIESTGEFYDLDTLFG